MFDESVGIAGIFAPTSSENEKVILTYNVTKIGERKLAINTRYSFRLRAENTDGHSVWVYAQITVSGK